jgi:hypothetical protein
MYENKNSSGFGQTRSGSGQTHSGSGHPSPDQTRQPNVELVPGSDESQKHQLNAQDVERLYPNVPTLFQPRTMRLLHPVRYMPPFGEYFDGLDKDNVKFDVFSKSCRTCFGPRHITQDHNCHEICRVCGRVHPGQVSGSSLVVDNANVDP